MTEEDPHLAIDRILRGRDLVTEALQMADAAQLDMLNIHLQEALLNLTEYIDQAETLQACDQKSGLR